MSRACLSVALLIFAGQYMDGNRLSPRCVPSEQGCSYRNLLGDVQNWIRYTVTVCEKINIISQLSYGPLFETANTDTFFDDPDYHVFFAPEEGSCAILNHQ